MKIIYKVIVVALTSLFVVEASATVMGGANSRKAICGYKPIMRYYPGRYTSRMGSVPSTTVYLPEVGMYLNQFLGQGGPMYQRMYARMTSINWQEDIKRQSVPIITRQELDAFYREKQFMSNLWTYLNNRYGVMAVDYDAYQYGYMLGMYGNVSDALTRFSNMRPDAIR